MTKHFESETCHSDKERGAAIMRVLDGTPLHAEPDIGPTGSFSLNWSKPGVGWGQATFYFLAHEKGADVKLYCDSEGMSKDFIKEMLAQMVDDSIFGNDGIFGNDD